MDQKEYIVTLKDKNFLEEFYLDMETPGGNLYIPDRIVEITNRRPVSRSTHYMLTKDEAELVSNDPRVFSVELNYNDANLRVIPLWDQNSNFWNKSITTASNYNNWGLLRSVEGEQRPGWGVNNIDNVTGNITITSSGKNVDVVIVDGSFDPTHPEFSVNSDGSGGTRVIQYNWFELNPYVVGTSARQYKYTPYVDNSNVERSEDNNHGAHVAGIACGNTQGWARDANIYSINPYSSAPSVTIQWIDYIREWHKRKSVNPITGVKNPTITNHSYGFLRIIPLNTITQVKYRGTDYFGGFDQQGLLNLGVFNDGVNAYILSRSVSFEQDLLDAMNEGIICIGAAGNFYNLITNDPLSIDYNNVLSSTVYAQPIAYNRGTITSAGNMICVGSISAFDNETKSVFSNCGPRIDVYAPGENIMSVVNSNITNSQPDLRTSAHYFMKYSGTSMASPQVSGIIACYAEQHPRIKQADVLEYVQKISKVNQITDTGGGVLDFTSLQNSPNRYLYYEKIRKTEGQLIPYYNYKFRNSSGMLFPRTKIYRYGLSTQVIDIDPSSIAVQDLTGNYPSNTSFALE